MPAPASKIRAGSRSPLVSLNLLALVAFVVPAVLILGSMGLQAVAPEALIGVGVLFALGLLACAAAMALLAGRNGRNREQSVVLLLPVAGLSMAGAFALLFGLSF